MRLAVTAILLLVLHPVSGAAQDHRSSHARQGSECLKTLTEDEVDGLLAGEGMGMARPAELNAHPGPRHVLDLADSLALTPEQLEGTRRVFDAMQARARELGRRVLEAEEALAALFVGGGVEGEALEEAVAEVARLRGQLRLVHLRAHLEVTELLHRDQIRAYQRLRGYAGDHGK